MKVFLSYRRADSAPWAGRLGDALAARYGSGNVQPRRRHAALGPAVARRPAPAGGPAGRSKRVDPGMTTDALVGFTVDAEPTNTKTLIIDQSGEHYRVDVA